MLGTELLGLMFSGAVGAIAAIEVAIRIDLLRAARELMAGSKMSTRIVFDPELSDDEKSARLLSQSKAIFLISLILILRLCAIVAVFAVLAIGVLTLIPPFSSGIYAAAGALTDWRMQVTALAVAIFYLWGRGRVSRQL